MTVALLVVMKRIGNQWTVSAVILATMIALELESGATGWVRRIGENEFEIAREALSAARRTPAGDLASEAHVVPYRENGIWRGLKIYAIRVGSDLVRAGFRNGDVILSVGGAVLTSPRKALEVYEQISKRGEFDVEILRHGEKQTFHYVVRG